MYGCLSIIYFLDLIMRPEVLVVLGVHMSKLEEGQFCPTTRNQVWFILLLSILDDVLWLLNQNALRVYTDVIEYVFPGLLTQFNHEIVSLL